MPHYYFHVQNGHGSIRDDEGIDLQDEAAARAMAMDSIRSMIAEDARKGIVDLDGFIDIVGHGGEQLTRIGFPEAFDVRFPQDKSNG